MRVLFPAGGFPMTWLEKGIVHHRSACGNNNWRWRCWAKILGWGNRGALDISCCKAGMDQLKKVKKVHKQLSKPKNRTPLFFFVECFLNVRLQTPQKYHVQSSSVPIPSSQSTCEFYRVIFVSKRYHLRFLEFKCFRGQQFGAFDICFLTLENGSCCGGHHFLHLRNAPTLQATKNQTSHWNFNEVPSLKLT